MNKTIDDYADYGFTVKRRKYYLVDEVDRHLNDLADEAEIERSKQLKLETQYQQLLNTNKSQEAMLVSLREKTKQQESIITNQQHKLAAIGDDLTQVSEENTAQSEHIAQLNAEVARLQNRIDHMNEQIVYLEKQSAEDVVAQAVQRADQIVARANMDSERMMQQANEQRRQLVSACRAAYYSALQFKKDLAEQFRGMERELDASIDVLQQIDNSHMSLNRVADPSATHEESGEVLS